MQGFEVKWKNFPHYIIGITQQIWEQRNIAAIRKYYSDDIIIRSPLGVTVGNSQVVTATMQTLGEFPDRTLLAEDVIWSGSATEGMLSSHRLLSQASHLGAGVYGQPTGKRLLYRIIADCYALRNQIHDEWIIRDQGAILRQLGVGIADYVQRQIAYEGGVENCQRPFTLEQEKRGLYRGQGNSNKWGSKYAEILQRIMAADLAVIPSSYDRACSLFYPGGMQGYSHADADKFWLGLRSSFPAAKFQIEHQIGRTDAMMPPRAALRWSLTGRHSGWGSFGPPSGAMVHIMAASHAEFGPWGVRREYTLFDEVAIWKQIILGRTN